MKITVTNANGKRISYDGNYSVTDFGVLTIAPDAGGRIVMSPTRWVELESTGNPSSGAVHFI